MNHLCRIVKAHQYLMDIEFRIHKNNTENMWMACIIPE